MVDMDMLTSPTAKDKIPDRTHGSDCVGYWINYEYPVTPRVQSRVY